MGFRPRSHVLVLCGLFVIRAAATWCGVAGGGMGGLFIPLVTQGAITGSIFERVVDAQNPQLFPTVGIAAFLGAGYRTPLAGVAFVAEATGEPGFLVPALLAAATAQLMMGSKSFSAYQRNERLPDLEPLSNLPVVEIMSPSASEPRSSPQSSRTASAKAVSRVKASNGRWPYGLPRATCRR